MSTSASLSGGGAAEGHAIAPMNSLVGPLLTDMYQVSMAYAYWKSDRVHDLAVFDVFFRKTPFGGEYCVFAGLDEVIKLVAAYRFTESDLTYLRQLMPHAEDGFFDMLRTLDCSAVRIFAMREGSIVFAREPLIRIEGPLIICQLLETAVLNLVNYASLVATNAARMRLAAGDDKMLIEFGLRRAQGPDGALSASKYAFVGGFDASSNVLAGKLTGISIKGTLAHSLVMTYSGLHELTTRTLAPKAGGDPVDIVELILNKYLPLYDFPSKPNMGELAAFIMFAQAFPDNFLALIDTYDTLKSGVCNFLLVGSALNELGYKPVGVRLDSGDLRYLSVEVRRAFVEADARLQAPETVFSKCTIVASNDINEEVLLHLGRNHHEIDCFGIGTHLVTCQKQPALGCVYKLVEINGQPRIKLSEEVEKVVIPCRKNVYRIWGKNSFPVIDVIQSFDEPAPEVGVPYFCRHPFFESKRGNVTPSAVVSLLHLVWDGPAGGVVLGALESIVDARERCREQLRGMREDHVRPLNPTPYKVSLSSRMYECLHELWLREAPITDIG